MSLLVIAQRPDYLAPGLFILLAFLSLWRQDPSRHHMLLLGLSFALAAATAAFVPVSGLAEDWDPARVRWLGLGLMSSLVTLLLGAAQLGRWPAALAWTTAALVGVMPLLAVSGLLPISTTAAADLAALCACAIAGAVLWRQPEPLLRLAGVLIAARGVNALWLTQLVPGYEVVERIGLNHLLGYTAGVVLLLGAFRRVIAEQARERDALQRLVDKRTRELERSRITLLAANEELQQLTRAVRGTLDVPLARIGAATARLAEGPLAARLDDTGNDYVRRMGAAAQRMQQIVQSLLTLSQAASLALQREPLDLTAMARECFVGLAARAAGPVPAFEVEDGLQVRADHALVASVLENLLGNAWKYSAKTQDACISLTRSPQAPHGFAVRDNGAGFDPADAGKLFVPFQRLHDAREFEGTGVGLATVQRIVARHGGRIWAEAAPGKGAAFHFTLGPD